MNKASFSTIIVFAVIGWVIWSQFTASPPPAAVDVRNVDTARLAPNWSAISAWPPSGEENTGADANPDPWQVTTLIILDDSSSMRDQMYAAKQAVVQAVGQLDPGSRVGVIALNQGMVTPVQLASDATRSLANDLAVVSANGSTPLVEASSVEVRGEMIRQTMLSAIGFAL